MLKFIWNFIKWFVICSILFIIAVMLFVDLPDSKKSTTVKKTVTSQPTVAKVVKADTSYKSSDKYAICYHNVTEAHKASGLHDRNRSQSIKIKEELCKIAATSTTGEGSAWLK